MPAARFALGRVLATPGALAALAAAGQTAAEFLGRHQRCDWGGCSPEDRQRNDDSVAHERVPNRRTRIVSAYRTRKGIRLWVITEHDRSATTILLPEEY
jgi:hypothetical protein